jgi:catechol 2,3-dioxygenase-like lactoylglutathione lyase family enzyme
MKARPSCEQYEKLYGVFGLRIHVVRLRLGNAVLELTENVAANQRGRVVPRDSRSNDRWFQHIAIITTDIGRAYQRLREHKVHHASTSPQRLPEWNTNAGGIQAFYFRDPDDHVLEVIQFPAGKGDTKWHGRSELFPGIDHTAIVVADTDQSLWFYRDLLGFKIVGGSENYGTEQAHLNNVPGAHLRITTLASPAGGPKIELLQYLEPTDGRAYPSDARPNDIFHWQTTIAASDWNAIARQCSECCRAGGLTDHALLVRDPDGHATLVVKEQ